MSKVQRNDPCPCGSGKKYKACHLGQEGEDGAVLPRGNRKTLVVLLVLVVAGSVAVGWNTENWTSGGVVFLAGLLGVGGFAVLRKPPPPNPSGGDPGALNFGR